MIIGYEINLIINIKLQQIYKYHMIRITETLC